MAVLATPLFAQPKEGVVWAETQEQAAAPSGNVGPDVIIEEFYGTWSWGSEDDGNGNMIAAFSVGTQSCNIGDLPLSWVDNTSDHPAIRQNLYRLKGGRFEQVGLSWVKHGFLAVNDSGTCGVCDEGPPYDELRPGCSDPYSATLNGGRSYLGPNFEINGFTGEFPWPKTPATGSGTIRHRLQVHHTDLDPAMNPGAKYFMEGQYIHRDDAFVGNAENNASYQEARITPYYCPMPSECICNNPYCLSPGLNTTFRQGEPAIKAWAERDATVRETPARVPGEGLFILSNKVTELPNGYFRYEYALYNMNSHRSAGYFRLPIPENALIENVGFHDVDYHSGEPWKGDDWTATIESDSITWATTPYEVDQAANALRWGTLYNFRLDINAAPQDSAVEVGLFRPGFPSAIAIRTNGPTLTYIDCNFNGVPDYCDVRDPLDPNWVCPNGCDLETCGLIPDCNGNGVPDDPACESDCNNNGIPDECDILFCPQGDLSCNDCNDNGLPDECEPDCDGDGTPDICEETLDTDNDGFDDCVDDCPYTTPVGACDPPGEVLCRINNSICEWLTWNDCLSIPGVPICGDPNDPFLCTFGEPCPETNCRNGCVVGDGDSDGDIDLYDAAGLQDCYTGPSDSARFIALPTGSECLVRFDFDEDGDIDLIDFEEFAMALMQGAN